MSEWAGQHSEGAYLEPIVVVAHAVPHAQHAHSSLLAAARLELGHLASGTVARESDVIVHRLVAAHALDVERVLFVALRRLLEVGRVLHRLTPF